jgi:hypothetical protein
MLPLIAMQTVTTWASPEDVWRAFEAVTRWPQTMRGLREVSLEPDGTFHVGSIIRAVNSTGDKRNERVVEAEPPSHLVLAIEEADFRSRTDYTIMRGEDGTDIMVVGSLEARGIGQTIRFLLWRQRMIPMLRTTLRERAQAIIDLAERMRNER